VGTSHREAFGRSAVEAAMAGIPVVVADTFGCADQLVRDEAFTARFVLPTTDARPWAAALNALAGASRLRSAYSDHVAENGRLLAVEYSVQAAQSKLAVLAAAGEIE
jgi:glycosyltransferase involved in cell wall biosynthesis